MMKKLIAIFMGIILILGLCSCGKGSANNDIDSGNPANEYSKEDTTERKSESETKKDIPEKASKEDGAENEEAYTEISGEGITEGQSETATEETKKVSDTKPTEGQKQTEGTKQPETQKQTEGTKQPETQKQTEGTKQPETQKQTEGTKQPETSKPAETPTVTNITTNEEMVRYILGNIITPQMSLSDKIYEVHKWMVDNIQYDTSLNKYYAHDALFDKIVVCQGYAEAFQLFMNELGVPCKMITGTANSGDKIQSHAWNAVQLNGGWYYVDVTWDDPLMNGHSNYPDGSNRSYEYYLVTESMIGADHFPGEGVVLPTPAGTDLSYHNDAVAKRNSEVMAVKVQEYTSQGYKTATVGSASQINNAVNIIDNYGKYAFVFNINNVTAESIIEAVNERVKSINNSVINGYSLQCPYGNDGVSDIWYVLVELDKYS